MRLIYIGKDTVLRSILVFRMLVDKFGVDAVVTMPSKRLPRLRNRVLGWDTVTGICDRHRIPYIVTRKFDGAVESFIRQFRPDLLVSNAHTMIIPKSVLNIPKMGTIGCHPSLLPKYRGRTPLHDAIYNGEKYTGLSTFWVTERIDDGAVIAQETMRIGTLDNETTLTWKIDKIAPDLIESSIRAVTGK